MVSRILIQKTRLPGGGWRLGFALGVGLLVLLGCGRSTEPIRHEVHKPIVAPEVESAPEAETAPKVDPAAAVETGPVISYPNIPEIPEAIRGPSAPIEEKSPKPES